jgi:phosphoglycolate phosphatase-like HAD superfamily hydrolase
MTVNFSLGTIATFLGVLSVLAGFLLWAVNHQARKVAREEVAAHAKEDRDARRDAFDAVERRLDDLQRAVDGVASTLKQLLLKGYRPTIGQ